MKRKAKKHNRFINRLFTCIGAVLCLIFGFMLICNITIIVKGTLNPEDPPSVVGITPLVVLSGSMSGDAPDHIEIGDLIFVDEVQPEDLIVGDIIAFKQGKTIVTHRIIEITTGEEGKPFFTTEGDANDTPDEMPVTEENLVGIYKGRIPKIGDLAMFIQRPLGMLLFCGIPIFAFIIYDILRRQREAERERKRIARMKSELKTLREQAGLEDPD